ncbi:MAG: NAD-dependent deacylase [Anaerolineae bacterium]|nr:NAD-dependent deacylase [Anaerolineae bacterium]
MSALRSAQFVVALTGAGVSAESGVPTFRQAQTGLWAQFDPAELATPEAFARNPDRVWAWYAWRRSLVEQAEPNPAHRALAELARRLPRFTLITQNVDGLHQRAGSAEVIELHGSLQRYRCAICATPVAIPAEAHPPRSPVCVRCGGHIRPDVVWFGEPLPEAALSAAFDAARRAQVFLSIGTSGLVEPAASLARVSSRAGALVVHVNPEQPANMSAGDIYLCGRAGEILPIILARLAEVGQENAR